MQIALSVATSKKIISAGLLCSSLLMAHISSAESTSRQLVIDSTKADSQRLLYTQAKTAFKKNHRRKYEQLKQQLTDYPLYAYLTYNEVNKTLSTRPYKKVDAFLKEHSKSYLGDLLLRNWLKHLASSNDWKRYLHYYQPHLKPTSLKCLYAQAQIKQGKPFPLELAQSLWTVGKSQPKQCDPVFLSLQNKGFITQDWLWKRHSLAITKKNFNLATYLRKKMAPKEKQLAELYLQVYKNPSQVSVIKKVGKGKVSDIFYTGLYRYAYSEPQKAYQLLRKNHKKLAFDNERLHRLKNRIAIKLIDKNAVDDAVVLMNSLPIEEREASSDRLLRYYLNNQQWDKINYWTNQLSEELASSDRWRYWKARSLEALQSFQNIEDEPEDHHAIYQQLAAKRSFYGFLAADKQQTPYSLEDKPASVNTEAINNIKTNPSLLRARELFRLGDMHRARREWAHGIKPFSKEELIAAGQLSHIWGWHRKSIEVMAKAKYWDDLSIRFPVAHESIVQKNADKHNIPTSLIFAIARQESAWEFDARSRVGARGLMQLMPATARETAKKSGLRYSKQKLFEPSYNIALGSAYISGLLRRFDNNRALAAASYNAGPHRVKKWRARSQARLPIDVWVEIIPFKETRKYVQNILSYEIIYNYRRGQKQQLLTEAEAGTPL